MGKYDWDSIFAWMTDTGASATEAGLHFNIPSGTINGTVIREKRKPYGGRLTRWKKGKGSGYLPPDTDGLRLIDGGAQSDDTKRRAEPTAKSDGYSLDDVDAYRERMILDVRQVRCGSSGIAFAQLCRLELELVAEIAMARKARASEEASTGEDETIQQFEADYAQLPEKVRRRIRSTVLAHG